MAYFLELSPGRTVRIPRVEFELYLELDLVAHIRVTATRTYVQVPT